MSEREWGRKREGQKKVHQSPKCHCRFQGALIMDQIGIKSMNESWIQIMYINTFSLLFLLWCRERESERDPEEERLMEKENFFFWTKIEAQQKKGNEMIEGVETEQSSWSLTENSNISHVVVGIICDHMWKIFICWWKHI